MGALNQRSTLLRMRPLPTSNTSTAGISVMPSSTATSLARKCANGRPRRFSTSILDDVAREHEGERHKNRQIRRRKRVEDDLGQEIRCERGRPTGERKQADQRSDPGCRHPRGAAWCCREAVEAAAEQSFAAVAAPPISAAPGPHGGLMPSASDAYRPPTFTGSTPRARLLLDLEQLRQLGHELADVAKIGDRRTRTARRRPCRDA